MQVICPTCGKLQEATCCCEFCKTTLQWVEACYIKSNKYYIKGYEYAKKREFKQAIEYLEKAILFNKYNTDAKNVLGLIHFEKGNVGEALKLWILSTSLQKENNKATTYIEQLQKRPKKVETYKETIHLYNRSLGYLKRKNDDVAIIRLKKAIHCNPKFVEARNLLALCYIAQKHYHKALVQVQEVLKIDTTNEQALCYLKYIEQGRDEVVQEEVALIPSPNLNQAPMRLKPNKVINRGSILGGYVIYFIFGALCMLFVQVALIMPAKTDDLQKQLYDAVNENSTMKLQLDTFTEEYRKDLMVVEEENQKLEKKKQELEYENNRLEQEKRIAAVKDLKNAGKWAEAAEILNNISVDVLSTENQQLYKEYKETVYPKASEQLYREGYSAYNAERYAEASSSFEKVILYTPEGKNTANAIYYRGEIAEKNSDKEKAIQYYTEVVNSYEGTSVAKKAQKRLDELLQVS